MKVEIREQLFLTNEESQILKEAQNLLSKIYQNCLDDSRLEELTCGAQDCIVEILQKSSLG